MNDTARRLRAQKAHSTDPAYLERMARQEETRGVNPTNAAAAEGGSAFAHRADNVIGEMSVPVPGRASCVRYALGERDVPKVILGTLASMLEKRQAQITALRPKVLAAFEVAS